MGALKTCANFLKRIFWGEHPQLNITSKVPSITKCLNSEPRESFNKENLSSEHTNTEGLITYNLSRDNFNRGNECRGNSGNLNSGILNARYFNKENFETTRFYGQLNNFYDEPIESVKKPIKFASEGNLKQDNFCFWSM